MKKIDIKPNQNILKKFLTIIDVECYMYKIFEAETRLDADTSISEIYRIIENFKPKFRSVAWKIVASNLLDLKKWKGNKAAISQYKIDWKFNTKKKKLNKKEQG